MREAVVTCVDYNGNGLVTYSGLETGQGAFDPREVGIKPYGFVVGVEVVGWWRPWSPVHI